ncbi:MAG: TraR/DksA family transcriptional regulator [Porticoccus sp.]|nr:TraR/DksA family transcriptional regulator [Porticoccus sp.]MBQ0806966.1 TraR/DksA family transcriptional regulator [Porticoccus sp.]MDX2349285.1 TraR/DksA family transcriptional regulator [Porticoccus sp.]
MEELTDKQLSGFRQSLIQVREELHLALDISEESGETVTLDQSKVGRLSRMDALQQQEMSNACRTGYRKRLLAVEQALLALDQGDYGWCESCGELIDIRRLEVRPESSLCVACQEASEI